MAPCLILISVKYCSNICSTQPALKCAAVINTLKIGDTFSCVLPVFGQQDIVWTLQKVNGEAIPITRNCHYPYKNCIIQYNAR